MPPIETGTPRPWPESGPDRPGAPEDPTTAEPRGPSGPDLAPDLAPDPAEPPGGTPGLALGPLASVAEALRPGPRDGWARGRRDELRRAFLDRLADDVEARGVAWIPERGPVRTGGRVRARELDLGLARGLAPGEVLDLSLGAQRRAPRAAAAGGWQVLVRTAAGVAPAGTLAVLAPQPLALDASQWGILAELVGGALARREPRAADADPDGVTGRASRVRHAARTHDLRNQLTLALLEVERLRLEPQPEALGGLARVLHEAHALCRSELGEGDRSPVPAPNATGDATAAPSSARTDASAPDEAAALELATWLPERVAQAARAARRRPAGPVPVELASAPRVLADERLLARCLGNLVTNALEAAGPDGHVRVTVGGTPEEARAAEGRVAVDVEDDGPGLTAEELRAVFQPGVSGAGGTGHGTSSVLEGLDSLGAELELATAPGRGTRARLWLQRVPDPGEVVDLWVDDVRGRGGSPVPFVEVGEGVPARAGVPRVVRVAGARAASALLRGLAPRRVVVARGTPAPELLALRGRCARLGVPFVVAPAGHGARGPEA